MHNFIAICQGWKDKAVVVITEKNSTLQHLQTAIDKIKAMEEWEKQREEENFHLKAELELARADHELAWAGIESAQADLESAHNDLDVVCMELGVARLELLLLRDDKEMNEWIIDTQEF